MRFDDSVVGIKGFLTIIKKYTDGREEVVLKDHNMIVSGMGVGLSDMLVAPDEASVNNFQIDRFQLGVSGNLSEVLTSSIHQLRGPLENATDYGLGTNLEIELSEQIVNNSLKILPAAKIPKGKVNKVGNNKVRYTLMIDEEACNNLVVNGNEASLNEIGMLIKNPTLNDTDRPILVCYKNFNPVRKTNDFSLVFRWTIVTSEVEAVGINSSYSLVNIRTYEGESPTNPTGMYYSTGVTTDGEYVEFSDIDSSIVYNNVPFILNDGDPAGKILRTGDLFPDKFQLLIPSGYNYNNNDLPLMVAFADFGQDRSFTSTFSALAEELNKRDCFGVIPLGDSGVGNYSKAMVYSVFSKEALNHTKAIVRYLIDTYPIDKDKIYFYGFGTGGGQAASVASLQLDSSPSGWYPASMILHDAVLSNTFTWWYFAASSLPSVSGTYPLPKNAELLPIAKSITYWCASSFGTFEEGGGNKPGIYYVRSYDYIPGILTNDGIDGAKWKEVSGITPDHKPFGFYEVSPIEFNLNTSSDLWLSGCYLMNLTHIPTYVQFNQNNPSGPPVTLPNFMLSSFLLDTTSNPYNIQPFNKQYSSLFVDWEIHPSSTGTHNLSSINLTEALDFCFAKQRTNVYSGITLVGRTGSYWGLSAFGYVQKAQDQASGYFGYGVPQIYEDEGMPASANLWPSGLAVMYWSRDTNENSLTLSSTFLCQDDSKPYQNMIINVDAVGLNHGTSSSPLIIKKLFVQTNRDATGLTSSFSLANDYDYPHPWIETWTSFRHPTQSPGGTPGYGTGARLGGIRNVSYLTLEGYSNAVILGWASSIRDTSSIPILTDAGVYQFEVPNPDTLVAGKVPATFGTISPTVYNSSGIPTSDQYARISRTRKNGVPFPDESAWRYLPNWDLTGAASLANPLVLAKVDKVTGTMVLNQRGMYIIYKP